jgi:DNA-binding transcriptional LysR family regulator
MHLEALKVFCDLASLRSFSKAAAANQMSQPTVTRLIHQLEDRLGGALIDRSHRPLNLTPLGQAYHAGCKRLLEQYAELEASLRRDRPDDLAVSIRVAAIYSVGLWDMGQYIERCAVEHPHARVRIDYLHPKQVYERVLDGTADLGLISYPARSRDLVIEPWRDEEMVVVCAPAHPLARLEAVQPRRLDGSKFVAFETGLAIRREVDHFLRRYEVGVEVVHEFDNIENIKRDIEADQGVGILPEPTVRREVLAGTLRAIRLRGCRLIRPLGIIHRRHQPLSSAARGFVGLLRCGTSAPSNGHNGNGSADGFPAGPRP